MVKNPLANAGDTKDMGSIPGREDPLEAGTTSHFSILAWTTPRTEKPRGLGSTGVAKNRKRPTGTHAIRLAPEKTCGKFLSPITAPKTTSSTVGGARYKVVKIKKMSLLQHILEHTELSQVQTSTK